MRFRRETPGNKGRSDPRQLLFARHHDRIMVTFNARYFVMLRETLVLWAALGMPMGSPLHAGIARLPSSSRGAPSRLVAALDELPRVAANLADRCFGRVPTTGWEEVVVRPLTP